MIHICNNNNIKLEEYKKKLNISKFQFNEFDENNWPFVNEEFDLIISNCSLNYNINFENSIKKLHDSLKPDGGLIGTMLGFDTLKELRNCFYLAENERNGGFVNRFVKLPKSNYFGNFLNKINFKFISVHEDNIIKLFESSFHLMEYLQLYGDNNIFLKDEFKFDKPTFIALNSLYKYVFNVKTNKFSEKEIKDILENQININTEKDLEINLENYIKATFQVINFIGWKYHPSQMENTKKSEQVSMESLNKELNEIEGEGTISFGSIKEDD